MARVFVSSTFSDLKDHRKAVYIALRRVPVKNSICLSCLNVPRPLVPVRNLIGTRLMPRR